MADLVVVEELGATVVVQEVQPAQIIEVTAVGPQGPKGDAGAQGAPGPMGDVTPEALAAKLAAEAAASAAQASQASAAGSATSAASSASSAQTSAATAASQAGLATTKASEASASQAAAATSATSASASAATAATKASEAATSATNAAASATSAGTSATTAGAKATEAASSATSAAASATSATTKAGEAASSATSAATSATSAANSATTASTKASEASASAAGAATSATNAAASASTATTKATEAAASATSASNSATSAANSATAASTSATQAAASASTATTKASEASTSATNAAASATQAASSATTAGTAATTATTKAGEASTSATNAAASAQSASTSATSAATSATNAAASETAASTSASAAASSATSAQSSATTATNQAGIATSKASEAAASATTASGAATTATTKASEASASATAAAGSATAAQSAQAGAEAAYDAFDDRYLGTKAAFPTTDNDGNPLIEGALFYHSGVTPKQLYIWTGSAWDQAAFNATGSVVSFNGRNGAVTLSSGDVTGALGFTPINKAGDTMTGALDAPSVSADYLQLDTAATPTLAAGRIFWNSARGVPTFGLAGGNVSLELGEGAQLVFNAEATPLVDGDVVYLVGAQGDMPSVKRASNASEDLSSKTIGVVTETIAASGSGFVTTAGMVNGLNTSAFAPGTILWLGSTPGSLTSTRPTAPAHAVFIGVVTKSNPGNGTIYVNPQNGYELDELHDVLITSATTDDILIRTAGGVWENKAPAHIKTALSLNNVENKSSATIRGELTSGNVTTALGYTPYNATNPSGYVNQAGARSAISVTQNLTYNSTTGVITGPDLSGYLTSATAASTYQPLDGDLTSIAALAGTTGLLRKTAANTWSLDTATYLTGNQTITFTGDATGSGSTSVALTLANSGVTAGTYRSVTVDAKGRVTGGTNPTTLSGYGITDAQPLDADLTAIAALTGTSGFLRTNGAGTWTVDTSTYLTTSTASSTYQTIVGMSSYLTTASASSTYAPLASPALTGTPTAPTAAVDTNTTQVATTAYVVGQGYLKSATAASTYQTIAGMSSYLTSATAASTYAPLASPALTGAPTAPTAAADTNTTQLATTAYVIGQGYLKAATAASTYLTAASASSTYAALAGANFTGTVGVGGSSVATRGGLQLYQSGITGGSPVSAAIGTDANQFAVLGNSNVSLRMGLLASGATWLQASSVSNYSLNYAMLLNPNGGNVAVGSVSPAFASGGGIYVANATNANVRVVGASSTGLDLIQNNSGWGYLWNRDNAFLSFGSNNTERMRIEAAGHSIFYKAEMSARVAMAANDIDLTAGNFFTKTISGATTLTVSNVPASGTTASLILDLTNGGSATITWWSGVKWAGGTAPTLTSAGRDVLGFYTHDGGTTWTGLVLGKDVR